MSSGSHLSKELHDLVKSIGETRSKQEEDKIIIKEVQQLKTKLNEKNMPPKKVKEMLIRAIYIEMLGHDASFVHINAIHLTQLGYLCCSLFLDNDSELLILLVATLQKDLASTNVHVVVNALTAVGKLISKTFVNALTEPVLKLLTHNTDIVRKKALMVMQIIRQLNQDCITEQDYDDRIRRGIQDKEPSVMGAAFNLNDEELKRGSVNKYKPLTGTFVSMLKQIIEHKLHKDYDYHRFPAPWLQIKLLQILTILGANDLKVSEQIYEVLGSTLRRADDTTINIGYAVTYQCVKCISGIYPQQGLLEQAANSVSRFLKSDNNNLKYLGINALTQIVSISQKYVLEHQMTIVDCLESNDDTLKKETLELLFKMTNEQNCEVIIQKLIHFLKTSSDTNFKKDLFVKVSLLNEKHAPTQEWFIKTANTLFEFGSEFIDNDVRNNFFKLLIDNFNDIGTEFGMFITEIYSDLLKNDLQDNILKIVCWVIGEIGSQIYDQDPNKLNELTQLVILKLDSQLESETTISWILTCLAKLQSARAFQMFDQTRAIFQKYMQSKNLDCQQRAIDFYTLAKFNAALKGSKDTTVDPKMSFLDAYVQQERQRGAQPYNPSLQVKAAALGSAAEVSSLNFGPYNDNKYGGTKTSTFGAGAEENKTTNQNPSAPTIAGPWDDTGYNQKQPPAPKPVITTPMAIGSTTGIGSSGTGQTTSKTTMQAMGSGQMGVNTNQTQNTYIPPVRPLPPKEDPNLKEKQKLANQLFAPISQTQQQPQQTQKKGISAVATQKPMNANPNPTQAPQQKPPAQVQNLLDIDDPLPSKQPITGVPQVYVQQPQIITQKPIVPQQQQPQQQWAQPSPIQTQPIPQQQTRSYIPANINVDQYEQLWERYQNVKEVTLQSRIKSEQDFKRMIQTININVIEVIEQEIICAGANAENKSCVLIYGCYNSNGSLDLKINGTDPKDAEYILAIIKRQFC
ncbi:unnamed protein product (macronuclear) [Paramecium tetraurelia]|uniref:AP-4 complex subunit epsilon-1 C-terminal domain-containing protein n=1 Tax=Paramecium tetraurelia TaxID=5888 RepID=A0BKM3_PARTE|nr:uncharacterized protein GSPATT00029721001 [Paramecium tetraurelia]CAK59090.1 unnamed protein product [Paramecium tetraurelia]|eukprot:XP_001426488.1 hypothetical protein (macronuclear) [Paramecium tetraurelia strain d4-2]